MGWISLIIRLLFIDLFITFHHAQSFYQTPLITGRIGPNACIYLYQLRLSTEQFRYILEEFYNIQVLYDYERESDYNNK